MHHNRAASDPHAGHVPAVRWKDAGKPGRCAPVFLCVWRMRPWCVLATQAHLRHWSCIIAAGPKTGADRRRPSITPRLPLCALTLALAAPAMANDAAPNLTVDHAARIDHHSGPVTARYRGALQVDHRQRSKDFYDCLM